MKWERAEAPVLLSRAAATRLLEPWLAGRIVDESVSAARELEQQGLPAVLLVPPALRTLLARFLRRAVPDLKVLSRAEIPDARTVRITAMLGSR